MTHKNGAHHDANACGELELSILPRGQLVQMVANVRRRLSEQRA